MKQKIIRFSGGLGNQLFQYAFGESMSCGNLECLYDVFAYKRDKKRQFELDKFINDIKKTNIMTSLFWYLVCKVDKRHISNVLYENEIFEYQNIDNEKNIRYVVGYWQNEKYFINNIECIRDKVRYNGTMNEMQQNILNQIKMCESVAVHIRHGDYLDKGFSDIYVCQNEDYYYDAISIILNKYPDASFYFFSDDIEYCKKNFAHDNCFFIDEKYDSNTSIDFELMRNCKHFIISNSTFSWWASKLSSNDEKIMISPAKWFRNSETNEKVKCALLKEYTLI